MRIVVIGLLTTIVVYILVGTLLFFRQNKMIYFPDNQDFEKCIGFANAQKIDANGTRAYFKENSKTLVVFYHGNAGSACDRTYIKDVIEKHGLSFLIVEYAGYSNDQRDPSKELLLKDAENMANFIEKQNFEKVLLVGESLGGAIAAHHANVGKHDKILLLTPFDSLAAVAKDAFPLFPTQMLMKENYNNVEMLQDKDNVWIVHGTEDEIIPQQHAKKLFESLKGENNQYFQITGAGHNNIFNFDETQKVLSNFLSQ